MRGTFKKEVWAPDGNFNPSAQRFEYSIVLDGEEVYCGYGYGDNQNVEDIFMDYLECEGLAHIQDSEYLEWEGNAYRCFEIYIDGELDSTQCVLRGYDREWSQDLYGNHSQYWSGTSQCLSEPINGYIDPRMQILHTDFKATTGESINYIIIPRVTILTPAIEATAAGQTVHFTVDSNCNYSASTDGNWLVVSPVQSSAGTRTFDVYLEGNSGRTREGSIIISYENEYGEVVTKSIPVLQHQTNITVSPDTQTLPAYPEESYGTLTVTADGPYFIGIDEPWLNISAYSGDSGTSIYTIIQDMNEQPSSRTAIITVGLDDYVVVEQEAAAISVSPTQIDAPHTEETYSATVTTNIPITATTNVGWITLGQSAFDTGTTEFEITVEPNTGETTRTATITVGYQAITISQEAFFVYVEPTSVSLDANNQATVTVTASGEYPITASEPWIRLSTGATQEGTITLTISGEPNTDETRYGTVYVNDIPVTVEQKNYFKEMYFTVEKVEKTGVMRISRYYTGSACDTGTLYYSLNDGDTWNQIIEYNQRYSTVTVPYYKVLFKSVSSGCCEIPQIICVGQPSEGAVTQKEDVIAYGNILSLVYGDAFTGQTTVPLQCMNPQVSSRIEHLVDSSGVIYPDYPISVSPTSLNYPYTGGSQTLTITANSHTKWKISSEAAWLSFSTSAGTGTTTVTVTAQALSGDGRTATITVKDNVVSVTQEGEVDTYLTMRIVSGGTINWVPNVSYYSQTIYYSKDNGVNWNAITTGEEINVATNDKIIFKGTNSRYYNVFSGSTASFNLSGNILSLIYGDDFVGKTGVTENSTFDSLFRHTNVIDASSLILPSGVTQYCCWNMFRDCTSLTKAPSILPATSLATYCYYSMFEGCTSLTAAPALPATTLASSCYDTMFSGCTSLTTAPELPAPVLVTDCYRFMFDGCTALNYIKCLATNIPSTNCVKYWVRDVAATGTFVKAEGMTGWTRGINGIPEGWTVPEVDSDYFAFDIISGGTINWKRSNNSADALAIEYSLDSGATWTSITATTEGVSFNVSAGDSVWFRGNTNGTGYSADTGNYCTFSGSTAYFNAKGYLMSIAKSSGFKSYNISAPRTFKSLFYTTNIVDASGLIMPSTIASQFEFRSTFRECLSLTTAPDLPAATLTNYAYYEMFSGCTNLNYVKCLATSKQTNSTTRWLAGVSATGTFVKKSGSSWTSGASGIPSGWTVQEE